MARPSKTGVRFMVRREGALWCYHRILRDDLAPHVVGKIPLPWRGRVIDLVGRKVVKISLGTSDQGEATRRRDELHVLVERLVDRARSIAIGNVMASEPVLVPKLNSEQIRTMADQFYQKILDSDDKWTITPTSGFSEYIAHHELMTDFVRHGVPDDLLDSPYAHDPDPAHSQVDTIMARNGLRLANDHPDRMKLALAMHRAMKRGQTDILKRHLDGEGIETPLAPSLLRDAKPTRRGDGKTLIDAFNGYCAEKRPKAKTAADYRLYCDRFTELFGKVGLVEITTEMMLDFKDALLQVPVDIPHALKARPFSEVVAWGRVM